MKIDPSKWYDEDYDWEDDIQEKKLTHRTKEIYFDKKVNIQKKRKEKMRQREEEERFIRIYDMENGE